MHEGQRVAGLRTLFRAAVSLTLAGGVGCSSRLDPADFSTNVCTGAEFVPLLGVSPTTPVDHLALRQRAYDDRNQPQSPTTLLGIGVPCGRASDMAACQRAWEAAMQTDGGWEATALAYRGPGRRLVAYTRGDTVGVVASLDALAAFLGPIELPVEAAWLANERGYTILCDGNNVRRAGTGFELRVRTGIDCGTESTLDEHVVAVGADGSLRVVESVRVQEGRAQCVAGRRGAGIVLPEAGATTLGDYFARLAELEAASVGAFERLAREPLGLRSARGASAGGAAGGAGRGGPRGGDGQARAALRGSGGARALRRVAPADGRRGRGRKRRRGLRARDLRGAPGHLPGGARDRPIAGPGVSYHRAGRDAPRGARVGGGGVARRAAQRGRAGAGGHCAAAEPSAAAAGAHAFAASRARGRGPPPGRRSGSVDGRGGAAVGRVAPRGAECDTMAG